MKHYRSRKDLMVHEIGTSSVIPYPIKQGELEIEKNIPLGKRNPNGMAIILAVDNYEDISFNEPKFTSRSGEIFRLYMENSFGLDDYQIFPSKPWQIGDGLEKDDIDNVFDPHQGIIRNRVISSNKYSKIDFVDINIFYTGLGVWIEKKPYLIPRDGINNLLSSLCSLEKILKNLSKLSVLENINSITLLLDIKYINSNNKDIDWSYPKLSNKICVLSASSIGESSIEDNKLKHSIFSYYLFKGLMGDAKGSDEIIEIGEIAEYLYRKIPNHLDSLQNSSVQNPMFIGSDLSRIFLDLR